MDIYIPEFKLGIEHNGLYWHSIKFKDKYYHIDKTNFFNKLGIDVIHVREDEWINKKDIVLSIIKNRMGLSKTVYARKTIKKEITSEAYRRFLDENHIQGSINSKIKLGLFYEGELISAAGLGKSRFKPDEFELHRFVNKLGYRVIGGFSKLLYGLNNITAYCDISHFNGKGYKGLGFVEESLTPPNYIYYGLTGILSRYQCMKHKLKDMLENFDSKLTETENMLAHGYLKIYDCGNIKLFLTK